MKNKKIIWISSIVGIVILLVIFFAFVFIVGDKTINFFGINYVTKEIRSSGGEEYISYPYILSINGVSKPVIDNVNFWIKDWKDWHSESFFGNTENSLSYLRDIYLSELESNDGMDMSGKPITFKESDIDKWSYEIIKNRLVNDFGYYHKALMKIDYYNDRYLSLTIDIDSYFGGAHPNKNYFGVNFDLTTGKEILFSDLFANYENEKDNIGEVVFNYSSQNTPSSLNETDCSYLADWRDEVIYLDYVEYVFSKKGLKILSFGYPYVATACEPVGRIVIPFSILGSYLKPNIIQ